VKYRIEVSPRADRDLNEQFIYIAGDSLEAAMRFLEAARSTFEQLATMPELGGAHEFDHPKLVGIRVWQVRKFERYLVFYRPIESGIEVVRVLHGSRDIAGVFEEEETL